MTASPSILRLFTFSFKTRYPKTVTHKYPVVSNTGPIDSGTPRYANIVNRLDAKNIAYAEITLKFRYSFSLDSYCLPALVFNKICDTDDISTDNKKIAIYTPFMSPAPHLKQRYKRRLQ